MATILVIDDDPQIRRLLARILTGAKHQVIEASDGHEGMSQFLAHKPALIITDVVMPEKEGIETIKEIRLTAPNLPILAISGGGAEQNMMFLDLAKALGADATLGKPFRAPELLDLVARLLAGEIPGA